MPGATKPRKKPSSAKTAWVDVEADPTGRFTRSNQVLGRGASKVVYKGFDRHQGIEVAWNQVKIVEHLTTKEHARLESEVAVLRRLKHQNIMTFYASWIDQQNHTLNFVTEYFHPGPLRRHRRNHKHLSRRVLKRWAWQILQGLIYLHGHQPPIIHRDLKCDNIFIHGTSGVVKIGDLGLAKLMEEGLSTCQSVLGTPEFMAPELYREQYNEKVDIYSFGMCLLELVTMEFPYRECNNKAQIFRQVTLGVYPAALGRIDDAETRSFIELCIDHFHENRPAARMLIKHPFFNDVRPQRPNSPFTPFGLSSDSGRESGRDSVEDDSPTRNLYVAGPRPSRPVMLPRPPSAPLPRDTADLSTRSAPKPRELTRQPSSPLLDRRASAPDRPLHRQASTPLPLQRTFSVQQRGAEGSQLDFELCMMKNEGNDFRRFKFTFDVEMDTVQAVTEEFEEEFGLTPTETEHFMKLLKEELERTPPKERFVPVELTSYDAAKGRTELQVKLGQDKASANGSGFSHDGLEGPRRSHSRKTGSRIIPEGNSPLGSHSPYHRCPASPAAYNQGGVDGFDRHGSAKDAEDKGVVLMRVSGDNVRPQQPRRAGNPNMMNAHEPRGFDIDGMEGMKELRPSPNGTEGSSQREFSVKAYRGDENEHPASASQRGGWNQRSPRSVSPEPRNYQPNSQNRSYYPDPHQQPIGQGANNGFGNPQSSESYQNGPAYQQNWGYQNNRPQGAMPTQDRRQPETPPGQWSSSVRQNGTMPGFGNTPTNRRSPTPKQDKWTEPGFHMPSCGPFPKSLQKIRSLFSDRHGRGSRYQGGG